MLNNKITNYIYEIECVLLFDDGDLLDLSHNVNTMTIENNYKEYVFPITNIILNNIDLDSYLKIKDNEFNVILTLRKYENDTESNLSDTVFKNMIMTCVNKPVELVDESNKNEQNNIYSIGLSLFQKKCLEFNKLIINANLLDTNIEHAILYALNDINQTECLIERPHNTTIYPQIIIPPLNPLMTIKYLSDFYGIYNSGIKLYFSFDKFYLLSNSNNKDTPITNNEFLNTNIFVKNEYQIGSLYQDCIKDYNNKCYYIMTDIEYIKTISTRDINNELFGNYNIISSKSIDENKKITIGSFNDRVKTKMYYNLYDNEYKNNELNSIINNNVCVQFSFSNLDIDAFNLNRIIRINFDRGRDYENEGSYQVIKSKYIFEFQNKVSSLSGIIDMQKI